MVPNIKCCQKHKAFTQLDSGRSLVAKQNCSGRSLVAKQYCLIASWTDGVGGKDIMGFLTVEEATGWTVPALRQNAKCEICHLALGKAIKYHRRFPPFSDAVPGNIIAAEEKSQVTAGVPVNPVR